MDTDLHRYKIGSDLAFCESPWDAAREISLVRYDSVSREHVELERGVNFFILCLEKVGATTEFSCEGHPGGFYVAFKCNFEVARSIAQIGYCTLELSASPINWHWVIRAGSAKSEKQNKERLRMLATAWRRVFFATERKVNISAQIVGIRRLYSIGNADVMLPREEAIRRLMVRYGRERWEAENELAAAFDKRQG